MSRRMVALAGLVLAGCGLMVDATQIGASSDVVMILTRSSESARGICVALGGDPLPTEFSAARLDSRRRVTGCMAARYVVICAEGDAPCLAHELRHVRDGAFHR